MTERQGLAAGEPAAPAAPASAGLPHGRWALGETVFWLLPLSAYLLLPGYLVLASQIVITGLFAVSLDLILGYAGIVSLGHAAFFGAGAYSAGLLAVHGWREPLSGLCAATLVAALMGLVTSFLVVRPRQAASGTSGSLSQIMVTLGIGLLLHEAANQAGEITGGVDGLSGVEMASLLGLFAFDLAGKTAFAYSLGVTFLVFLLLKRVVASPFGLSLRAVRENEQRMLALGAPVSRRLIAAYTLSAAVAGCAGALLAQTTQFVGLDVLSFSRSAAVLVMLVLGGVGKLYGGLVGAALFMTLQDLLAGNDPVYWQFWIGLCLVLLVFFAKGGVLGGVAALERRWRQRSAR
ncbi:MAG: branched-chain amino acid ABC transporter permease [Polyangiaceae bacterium]